VGPVVFVKEVVMRLARQVAMSAALVCMTVLVPIAQAALPDFTPLAENQSKAVVNISASAKSKGRTANQQEVPEIFRRFLGMSLAMRPHREISNRSVRVSSFPMMVMC
jgi:S1-C subfamily serine protease